MMTARDGATTAEQFPETATTQVRCGTTSAVIAQAAQASFYEVGIPG